MNTQTNLYKTDFHAWCFEQAKNLEAASFDKLDLKNLAEEIDSMGRKERTELRNHLIVLFSHLLKMKYQPDYCNKDSWIRTIREQRNQIELLMEDSPSLQYSIDEISIRAYEKGLRLAEEEMSLSVPDHKLNYIMTLKNALTKNWLP